MNKKIQELKQQNKINDIKINKIKRQDKNDIQSHKYPVYQKGKPFDLLDNAIVSIIITMCIGILGYYTLAYVKYVQHVNWIPSLALRDAKNATSTMSVHGLSIAWLVAFIAILILEIVNHHTRFPWNNDKPFYSNKRYYD